MPGGWEWILIILAVVLLFGGKKIPELMKGLGQGMKEFKKARNESDDLSKKDEDLKRDSLKE
jgi:sec-independent protein translocase protein TatA